MATQQAQEAVVDGVEEIIVAFDRGELLNVVNNAANRSGKPEAQHTAESRATR